MIAIMTITNAASAEEKQKFNPINYMPKDLFTTTPELSVAERENQLKASCYHIDAEFTFDRPFTPEEKDRKTRELIELMDEIDVESDAIKAEVKLRRQMLKDLDKQRRAATKSAKKGAAQVNEKVYLMDDQDEGQMHIYDMYGKYILSRPLLPKERQTYLKVTHEARTGTND